MILRYLKCALSGAACCALCLNEAGASSKPNIMLILMDDLGINDLGAYTHPSKANPGPPPAPAAASGSGGVPNFSITLTPRIDALADQGARLTHFYSTSSVCSPTRAALLTGSYPRRVRIESVLSSGKTSVGLNSTEVTLPELLREQGYLTAMSGKWHLGTQRDFNPVRHGFERYFGILHSHDMWKQNPYNSDWPDMSLMADEQPLASYTTATGGVISGIIDTDAEQSYLMEAMTERVLGAIDDAVAESRPFFVYFSPHTPHVPMHPHPDFLSPAGQTNPQARYSDVIREVDHRVGQILDKIESKGLTGETIVVLTSDNGPWLARPGAGDLIQGAGSPYPFRGSKNSHWEGGHRVPFIARFPGVIPPAVLMQTATTLDLYPTLAQLGGASVPQDRVVDGVDLLPVLSGSSTAEPRSAFHYYSAGAQTATGIIDLTTPAKYKLIGSELYRIGTGFTEDFQEIQNRASTEAAKRTELQGKLSQWNSAMSPRAQGTANSVSIQLESDRAAVNESGLAEIRVRLRASSNKTVTISKFSGDPDLDVFSGGSLVFTTANWSQWQTVTFAASANTGDDHGGATFRAEASGTHIREIYIFESGGVVEPTEPPPGLDISPHDEGALLEWQPSTDPAVVGYTVLRAEVPGSPGEVLAADLTATTFTDATARTGRKYFYSLQHLDADGNAVNASAEIAAIGGPAPQQMIAWDFSGLTPTQGEGSPVAGVSILTAHHANAIPGITSSDLTGGGSLRYSTANPASGEANLKEWELTAGADGIHDGDLSFTLTADRPGSLSLRSVSIRLWRNGPAAPPHLQFLASVDGEPFTQFGETLTDPVNGDFGFDTFTFHGEILEASSITLRFAPVGGPGNNPQAHGNLHINALTASGQISDIARIPQIRSIRHLGDRVEMEAVELRSGAEYRILRTADLYSATPLIEVDRRIPVGSVLEFTDAGPLPADRAFYRLQGP